MILVTVGTEKFPFNRLMQWINNLIKQGLIGAEQEEIVIQYGSCTIIPHQVNNYSVLPSNEFKSLLKKARLIIAHCGEGTLDMLAATKKPFILVPRSSRFQEHVDDHQLELAEMLAEQGVPIANSPGDLVRFLANPVTVEVKAAPSNYYAKASLMLEAQFNQEPATEKLVPSLT